MKNEIRIAIRKTDPDVVIAFENGPIRFVTLFVADGERVMWELYPSSMQAVSENVAGQFISFAVPSAVASAAAKLLLPGSDDIQEKLGHAAVHEIVYGHVPDGYAEEARAEPLVSGINYTVVVQKVRSFGSATFTA